MPTVPALPQDAQSQMSQAIDPQNFLIAAADLHQQGALSSPMPRGTPLGTGKPARGSKRIRVIK